VFSSETLLVVPAFNEGQRLAAFLPDLCNKISTSGQNISLLVIDDGSLTTESTAMRACVESLRATHPFLHPLLTLPKNLGKGGAIYAGWDTSTSAEWLGFIDADGAVPAAEAIRFAGMAHESTDTDGLFANRIHMLGRPIERTFTRHLAGRIYATLSANLTGIPVYDSQCGLKFVRRSCYQRIRPDLTETRFGFDMELIALLHSAATPEHIEASSVTSMASARTPAGASSSSRSTRRAAPYTVNPSSARRTAAVVPMPDEAPVMSADLVIEVAMGHSCRKVNADSAL